MHHEHRRSSANCWRSSSRIARQRLHGRGGSTTTASASSARTHRIGIKRASILGATIAGVVCHGDLRCEVRRSVLPSARAGRERRVAVQDTNEFRVCNAKAPPGNSRSEERDSGRCPPGSVCLGPAPMGGSHSPLSNSTTAATGIRDRPGRRRCRSPQPGRRPSTSRRNARRRCRRPQCEQPGCRTACRPA